MGSEDALQIPANSVFHSQSKQERLELLCRSLRAPDCSLGTGWAARKERRSLAVGRRLIAEIAGSGHAIGSLTHQSDILASDGECIAVQLRFRASCSSVPTIAPSPFFQCRL